MSALWLTLTAYNIKSAKTLSGISRTKNIFFVRVLTDISLKKNNTTYSTGITDPVQMVTSYHAIALCNKLSIAEGLTPVYSVSGVDFSTLPYASIPTGFYANWDNATCNWSADGYRLPTEMEWMWAAMGADQGSQPGAMSNGINVTGFLFANPFGKLMI